MATSGITSAGAPMRIGTVAVAAGWQGRLGIDEPQLILLLNYRP